MLMQKINKIFIDNNFKPYNSQQQLSHLCHPRLDRGSRLKSLSVKIMYIHHWFIKFNFMINHNHSNNQYQLLFPFASCADSGQGWLSSHPCQPQDQCSPGLLSDAIIRTDSAPGSLSRYGRSISLNGISGLFLIIPCSLSSTTISCHSRFQKP